LKALLFDGNLQSGHFNLPVWYPPGITVRKSNNKNIIDFLFQVTPLEWGIPEISTPWLHLRCVCLFWECGSPRVLPYTLQFNCYLVWHNRVIFQHCENPEDGNFCAKYIGLKDLFFC